MKKKIYKILNRAEMDEREYESVPLEESEIEDIMCKFRRNNITKKNEGGRRIILKFIGVAAAAAIIVTSAAVMSKGSSVKELSDGSTVSTEKQSNSFFLTASAAEAENMQSMTAMYDSATNEYSYNRFRISGSNIKSVHLNIDRGSLYKGTCGTCNDPDFGIVWTEDFRNIGNDHIDDEYSSDTIYGLCYNNSIYPDYEKMLDEGPVTAAMNKCGEAYDGGVLTVTVTYDDNSTQLVIYDLKYKDPITGAFIDVKKQEHYNGIIDFVPRDGSDTGTLDDPENTNTGNSFYLADSPDETENKSFVYSEQAGGGTAAFTGDLFFVKGNNIDKVSLSMEKGEMYKGDITKIRQQREVSGNMTTVITEESCEYIGSEYVDNDYNENTCYGIYFSEEKIAEHEAANGERGKKAYHDCYDDMDGGKLTITVTFKDGSEKTETYDMQAGMMVLDKETMQPTGEFTDDPCGGVPWNYGTLFIRENH